MLIDSHCHLDFPELNAELDAVLTRAQAGGVGLMVTISTRVHRFNELRSLVDPKFNEKIDHIRSRKTLCNLSLIPSVIAIVGIILATILLPDQTKSPVTLGLFAFKGTYTSEWSLLAAATLALPGAPLKTLLRRPVKTSCRS